MLVGFLTAPAASLFVLVENLAVILTIWGSSSLHRPMHYFPGILSSLEIWYVSDTIPKMLDGFLMQRGRISFVGCMTQLYVFSFLVCTGCVLLASVACDGYQAIMTMGLCVQLVAFAFVSGFTISVIKVSSISSTTFCGSNVLKHIFCDISPILKLACTDFSTAELVGFVLTFSILVFPLVATMLSYGHITLAAPRVPSATGRQRAFSTRASCTVTTFYIALIFMYVWPQAMDPRSSNKLISAVYTVLTPVINPLICCLRNKEFKDALKKALDLGQLSQ